MDLGIVCEIFPSEFNEEFLNGVFLDHKVTMQNDGVCLNPIDKNGDYFAMSRNEDFFEIWDEYEKYLEKGIVPEKSIVFGVYSHPIEFAKEVLSLFGERIRIWAFNDNDCLFTLEEFSLLASWDEFDKMGFND